MPLGSRLPPQRPKVSSAFTSRAHEPTPPSVKVNRRGGTPRLDNDTEQKQSAGPLTQARLLRQALGKMFKDGKFDCAVTLVTHWDTPRREDERIEMARAAFKDWLAALDRALLGRNWSKRPTEERTLAIVLVENQGGMVHMHGVVRFPPNLTLPIHRLLDAAKAAWQRAVPGGGLHCPGLETPARWASYVAKRVWRPESFERMLVSSDFHGHQAIPQLSFERWFYPRVTNERGYVDWRKAELLAGAFGVDISRFDNLPPDKRLEQLCVMLRRLVPVALYADGPACPGQSVRR